jgi:hypothetical protein
MSLLWPNSVDLDFGNQTPKLHMRTVHGFVRTLNVPPEELLGLVAVLDRRNQVARVTFKTEARTREFLNKFEGTTKAVVEGREINVVIRDSNVDEKFVRIAGIPQNLELGVVQTRLREFGTVIDMRWERYRTVQGDDVMYPVLATWMIVRMTVTKNIPSYVNIGSYRAIVKYEGQRPTCRLCDDESHFSNTCPKIRRNREIVVEKPEVVVDKPQVSNSKTDETITKNQSTNKLETEIDMTTSSPEGNLKELPSGNDTSNNDSETSEKETTQTENTTTSPETPPGQNPPLNSSLTIIPETQFEPPLDSMVPMDPEYGTLESMETDGDPRTINQNSNELGKWQTAPKRPRTQQFKPTLTTKNSRPSKTAIAPDPKK